MRPELRPIGFEVRMFVVRLAGLRDRLRCPACGAVGTWKPHDGIVDSFWVWAEGRLGKGVKTSLPPRGVRRWLCKWCGHYVGPEGTLHAHVDHARGTWVLPPPYDVASDETGDTPATVVLDHMGKTWPWRG